VPPRHDREIACEKCGCHENPARTFFEGRASRCCAPARVQRADRSRGQSHPQGEEGYHRCKGILDCAGRAERRQRFRTPNHAPNSNDFRYSEKRCRVRPPAGGILLPAQSKTPQSNPGQTRYDLQSNVVKPMPAARKSADLLIPQCVTHSRWEYRSNPVKPSQTQSNQFTCTVADAARTTWPRLGGRKAGGRRTGPHAF